jgi:hypothetical protein
MTPLERRYRLLLRAYPRSYREHRGEEMLDTLLEAAGPDRKTPTWRDAADLVGGGVRERAGAHAVPGFANGLRLAGPIALAMVAGVTGSAWLVGERTVAASVVAVAWVAAVVARTLLPRTGALPALGATLVTAGATLVTAASTQAAIDAAVDAGQAVTVFPPMFVGTALAGLVATVGTAHRPRPVERVAVPAGALFVAAFPVLATLGSAADSGASIVAYHTKNIVDLVLVGLALAGAVTLAWRRDARPWWALLVLLIAVPAVVFMPMFSWVEIPVWVPGSDLLGSVPATSGIALVVLAVCVHLRRTAAPLASCGVLSLVMAAGLSAYAWFMEIIATGRPEAIAGAPAYFLFLLAAAVGPGRPGWQRWVRPALTASAVIAILATAYAVSGPALIGPALETIGVLTLLGLIALASPRSEPASRPAAVGGLRRLGAITAVAVVALALAATNLGIPNPDLYEPGVYTAYSQEAFVPPAIAMVAFVATMVATAVAVLSRDRRWAAPLAAFAVGTLGVVVFCHLSSDSRVIAAMVATAVALLIAIRLASRARAVSRTTPGMTT